MKLTFVLILLCITTFAGTVLFVHDTEPFYNYYGFSAQNFFERPWVSVTSLFLHGSLEHLLANILVLFFFGTAVEKELGSLRMGALFLLGGLAGDFASALFYAPDVVGIGASAAIFSLVGIGMLVRPFDLSFYPMIMPVPLVFLGALYIFYNIVGFFTDHTSSIAYIAHVGGMVVGLGAGCAIKGFKKGLLILTGALIGFVVVVFALSQYGIHL